MIIAKMKENTALGHCVNVMLISMQLTSIKCIGLLLLLALQSKDPYMILMFIFEDIKAAFSVTTKSNRISGICFFYA